MSSYFINPNIDLPDTDTNHITLAWQDAVNKGLVNPETPSHYRFSIVGNS